MMLYGWRVKITNHQWECGRCSWKSEKRRHAWSARLALRIHEIVAHA